MQLAHWALFPAVLTPPAVLQQYLSLIAAMGPLPNRLRIGEELPMERLILQHQPDQATLQRYDLCMTTAEHHALIPLYWNSVRELDRTARSLCARNLAMLTGPFPSRPTPPDFIVTWSNTRTPLGCLAGVEAFAVAGHIPFFNLRQHSIADVVAYATAQQQRAL